MEDLFPKWLCKLLSHMSCVTLGIYLANTFKNPNYQVEPHQWAMTIVFGLMFFVMPSPNKS